MVRTNRERPQDLLNFHFPVSPSQGVPDSRPVHSAGRGRSASSRGGSGRHHQPSNSRIPHQNSASHYRRTKEDRASARKKAASNMFYLHSSPDHAFVLTRKPAKQAQSYTFLGSDQAVSWESVRIVKYLSTVEKQQDERCPICLDTFACPRITKCGHIFCLPCILHHVQAFAQAQPYAAHGPRCPCCAIALHVPDLRPVQFECVTTPAVHHTIRLVKLHRVAHSGCPAPFLPRPDMPRRSAPHAAPCQVDADASYCRFNYVDPETYRVLLEYNLQELAEHVLSGTHVDIAERNCQQMARNHVQKERQIAAEEVLEELALMERFQVPSAGIYQPQPKQLLWKTYEQIVTKLKEDTTHCPLTDKIESAAGLSAMAALKLSEPYTSSSTIGKEIGRFRSNSVASSIGNSVAVEGRSRASSTISHDDTLSTNGPPTQDKKRKEKKTSPMESSMFLDTDESAFYQATDGTLCFLSGFNMKCLRKEFSPNIPETDILESNASSQDRHKVMPLPDAVEGSIVEIERVHLSPESRQRLRFLSHLPLYADILFVEINLGSLLSSNTKNEFKKDFSKRKQIRLSRINAERKEDERIRRIEDARILELKSRIQCIDPHDDFFRSTQDADAIAEVLRGDDFGPALGDSPPATAAASPLGHDPSISFSAITRTGGAFPAFASNDTNFPSLSTSPAAQRVHHPVPTSWGRPKPIAAPPPQQNVLSPKPSGSKKSRGKKVLLFSMGGGHGY